MFYKYAPFLLALAAANPIFIGSPQTMEYSSAGGELFHHLQPSNLISQQPGIIGNLEKLASYSKNLLASHVLKPSVFSFPIIHHPSSLGFASSLTHHVAPISYPIPKEVELPEKIKAGALIKEVPKTSKLPIKIEYSPKSLMFSPDDYRNFLEAAPVVSNIPQVKDLGFSYGL